MSVLSKFSSSRHEEAVEYARRWGSMLVMCVDDGGGSRLVTEEVAAVEAP